jgi:CDP-glycerol glycerophosphotransferase (TagB/SpsB family)
MSTRLLFYVSKLYSLPVVQPLAVEAKARRLGVALFVSSKVRRNLPEELEGIPVFTELKDAIAYKPLFVLCPGNFVDFRLPGIKVELFHGIGVEKPSHYRIRHFFDMYLTSGPVVTERFKALQKKHRYFRTVETGWSKIDHILKYNTTDLRKRYDIPAGRKVILYSPTHSRTMQSATLLLPEIKKTMKPDEIWLCKPHEFMNREFLNGVSGEQLRIIKHYDITPYLHLADVMISDTSSVIYEFMVLDKPVVTFKTLARKDKGIDIHKPRELRVALDRSFLNPGEFSNNRKRHLEQVNPKLDGTVSQGIIDFLSTIDPEEPMGASRKPLNVFRKLQILYHSRFRKGYMR